jgi:hypothetical protein
MPNNSRLFSSLIFLGLGVFAGTKLGSNTVAVTASHSPVQKFEAIRDTVQPAARGPASVSSGPLVSLEERPQAAHESPLEGFDKPENFLKLKDFTKRMEKEFEAKYLRNHFVIPHGEGEWLAANRVLGQKVGTLINVSRYWKAKFMLQIKDANVPATAKIDLGVSGQGPNGQTLRQCGYSVMTVDVGGSEYHIQLDIQCGHPAAAHDDRLYTWGDTMWDPEMRDVLIYVMLPLPDEGGSGYFLETSTLKWRATEEIRWETASEVDFKR